MFIRVFPVYIANPIIRSANNWLAIETIKERQKELINNREYGLLHSVADSQIIKTRTGAPTPDDLDELITKVWKEPGFFLLHPLALPLLAASVPAGVPPPRFPYLDLNS
jgi:hypothetical protein